MIPHAVRGRMQGMSAKINDEQLEKVRQWAAEGIDLNGIQKNLQAECGVHLTYMDVRFLLLDHNIVIATEPAEEPKEAEPETPESTEETPSNTVKVTLDDLQLPGALISGKATFPGGAHGAWMIDQMGRFGWSELNGQPTPDEMGDFERELTALLSRG